MKLQMKVDDLLKKVEGLIIKDIAARKEHNRKVAVINSKVDEYIDGKKGQLDIELDKAKAILSKYSDDELKGMFLEEEVISYKGVFFNRTKETVHPLRHSLELEGISFMPYFGRGVGVCRNVGIKIFRVDCCGDLMEYDECLKIVPIKLTTVPSIIRPRKKGENIPEELSTLKDKLLQAKSHRIEECILEDDDLVMLDEYGKGKDYTLESERLFMQSFLVSRIWGNGFDKEDGLHWRDIVSEEGL